MIKQIIIAIIIFGAILSGLLTACAGTEAQAADPLDGTAWELAFYRKSAPVPGSTITLSFNDGEISGSAGCNTYGGAYQVDGSEISISQLYFTEMACMDPDGVMEQEQTYLGYLDEAYRFELSGDQLLLYWTPQETLTFVPGG